LHSGPAPPVRHDLNDRRRLTLTVQDDGEFLRRLRDPADSSNAHAFQLDRIAGGVARRASGRVTH